MTSTFDDADAVARRSANLSALLARTDEAPRRIAFPKERVALASRRAVLLRRLVAAAAVALLLVGTVVPPVRAWIAGGAKALWSMVSRPAQPPVAASPAMPAPDTAVTASVSMPAVDPFVLEVVARQAAGQLVIDRSGASASAAIQGRSSAELMVLPGGLRIVNAAGDSTSYVVRVPAGVSRLTVRVAGVELPPADGSRRVIDLRAGH